MHYRGHDAFLFTSWYEAWGMPVLEAMASGLAVVTTKCYGVSHFAQHGLNCLMAAPGDFVGGFYGGRGAGVGGALVSAPFSAGLGGHDRFPSRGVGIAQYVCVGIALCTVP